MNFETIENLDKKICSFFDKSYEDFKSMGLLEQDHIRYAYRHRDKVNELAIDKYGATLDFLTYAEKMLILERFIEIEKRKSDF